MEKIFKHLKTGDTYFMLRDDVINCTNANNHQTMVLYKREGFPELIFVREKKEFYKKFEEIN